MSSILKSRNKTFTRAVLLAATAAAITACSGSVDRFSDYPDVNTASLPRQPNETAVDKTPLDAPNPPRQQAWQNAPVNQRATYQANEPARQQVAAAGQVMVAPGETLYSIARTHGIAPAELARYNDIPPPYHLKAGQVVRIPGNATRQVQATNQPLQQNTLAQGALHVVRPGETLYAVGRAYNVHPFKIADYNGLPHDVALKAGQQLRIPGREAAQQQLQQPVQQQQAKSDNLAPQKLPEPPQQVVEEQAVQKQAQAEQPAPEIAGGGFRWPVRGKIISTFGQKPNGMRNEGINIAVPEGTSVKAAESGVVAYAGNELKGYGNLVLIRHENGWVTAYAHNRELFVKRGDTVKRGDIIAKAGQTGSVTSPQLHFEVRKGSAAVDPLKYLSSEQAAN
jgi:murein DD-endopeptidase MepM/ murein hydrolase activator NlpD